MPFVTVNSHKIHYTDTLSRQPERGHGKPAIIMIHGLGSSQNYYMPTIPYIEDFRCIALDTYGAARSKSQGEDVALDQLAQDVIGMLDSLSISKAVVVGHSMGGPMACLVAAADQPRIVGLVAIGPVNPTQVNPDNFTSRIDIVSKDGMEPLANSVPPSATGSKSTPLQKALIRELILGQDPKSYASLCRAIIGMKPPPQGFESITVPALLIAGEQDQSAPLAGVQYIHDHLGSKQKELIVLEGVGHWHCIEAGDQVGAAIQKFCSSV